MNLVTLFPAIALHGTLLVCGTCAVWLCLRRQSAARVSAGGRLIMAATLLLAAGEIILAARRAPDEGAAVSREAVLPALPPQPGPVSGALPAPSSTDAGGASADVASPLVPAVAVEAPPAVRQWELSRTMASFLTIVWLAGAALIGVRWTFAMAGRRRWQRSAHSVEDAEWLTLLRRSPSARE